MLRGLRTFKDRSENQAPTLIINHLEGCSTREETCFKRRDGGKGPYQPAVNREKVAGNEGTGRFRMLQELGRGRKGKSRHGRGHFA